MNCPACSSPNAETSRFCAGCGAALVEPSAEPTREQPHDRATMPRAVDVPHG